MNKQCHLCRDVPGLLGFCRTGILELKLREESLLAAMTCLDQNVTGNWLPQPWHRQCRLGTQQPRRLPAFLREVLAMPVSVGCRVKPFPLGCLKELGNTKRPRTNGTRSHPKDRVPRVLPVTPSCAHISQPGGVTAITSNTPAARSDRTALVGGHLKKKMCYFWVAELQVGTN